jgi:hypothetical protein
VAIYHLSRIILVYRRARWARTRLRAEPQDDLRRRAKRRETANQLRVSNVLLHVLLAAWFVRAKPL